MKKSLIRSIKDLKPFLILWSGQSMSQLGSAMTSFALIIWAYQIQGTVMSVALLSVFSYLPYVFVSLFAGALIDRIDKKKILLVCDAAAALCTALTLVLMHFGALQVWHLYLINMVTGFMNAFQAPANKAVVVSLVPREHYMRTSGLRSMSESAVSIFTPILASAFLALLGINMVLVFDLITFGIAFSTLLFLVKIPRSSSGEKADGEKKGIIRESLEGFSYLRENKGFFNLMLFLAGINLIASMAFFSVMPAMILSRTGNNERILGLVSGAVGVGGLVGSFLVTLLKPARSKVKTIFVSAGLSFLLCDLVMGSGQMPWLWVCAAFAGNLPIPFLNAAENELLLTRIPASMQGRIFAIRGSLQFITVPLGYLAGGFLADQVFEPLMKHSDAARSVFGGIVGLGTGSGMALMFIVTGLLGFLISWLSYGNKAIRLMDQDTGKRSGHNAA